jgi:hypothetical protein
MKYNKDGYEVSSKGDKRFSAYWAKLKNGNTIEYEYQVVIKGYNSIKEGKGKPPLNEYNHTELWFKYKSLWEEYLLENPNLLLDIARQAKSKCLTDHFSTSDINQAHAISEILNETYEIIKDKL